MTKPKSIEFFNKEQAQSFAEVLKALGHPVRLQIVDILSGGTCSVTELSELTGQQQAIVSQQLKILRLSGLVHAQRADGKAYYSLLIENLTNLMSCLRSCKSHME
jgi:ArsR family transcriptional regulator